jgi:hypothetical protein
LGILSAQARCDFPCIVCKRAGECQRGSKHYKPTQNIFTEEATMRSLPLCAAWLILVGVNLELGSVRTQPLEIIFFLFLAIYATQAFVAEALGVRVGNESISFPRRLVSGFPFLVFWRVNIKWAEIDQMISRPNARVRVQKNTGERLQVSFGSREARLRFFQFVRQAAPSISISR